ncbi:MAG TPA: hypothetical protein VNH20_04630 [Candidatus Dormibacteraeota bacterium]|nr:hypothetical protein [Candidatus Dormibacteraeota bacterium]
MIGFRRLGLGAMALAIAGTGAALAVPTVLAWNGPPTITPLCSPNTSEYSWQVSFGTTESNYNIDIAYSPTGPWSGSIPSLTQPYTFTTQRSAGSELYARWDSDHTSGVFGPVTGDSNLCSAPTIATQTVPASPIAIGTSVYDTAKLSGATPTAGGTVTYGLYSDSSCQTLVQNLTPASNAVSSGIAPHSNSYTFPSAGTWYFQATYSGDSSNAGPVSSPCGSEAIVVNADSPTIATQTVPGGPVAIGTSVYDTATLTGATANAGGTISYALYSDSSCSYLVMSLTPTNNAVVAGLVPHSNSYAFTAAGTWYFQATYSGDNNNVGPVSSSCMSEGMVVNANHPSIATQTVPASPVSLGTSVYDTAALTGATANAGGTISYGLYSDASCANLVVSLTPTNNAVVGGVVPHSNSYVFNAAGDWYFEATYSGDNNNVGPVSSSCATEEIVVMPDSPSLTTNLSSRAALVGGSVTDTATLSGASATASGAITISLFSGSDASACSGTALASETASPVTLGSGSYSATFGALAQGSYELQASFAGDANDTSAVSVCGTEPLTVSSPSSGQLAASTGTPVTGSDLFGSGLAGALALLLGGLLVIAGTKVLRLRSR